ncbi:MAG TPA: metal ABC transporter substrate-binding protein [Candidatus Limnocylindrales bacterium]|nr:metal ABC transporter substrate-binding protein [Candidatus Limnocylindrales bacterium]
MKLSNSIRTRCRIAGVVLAALAMLACGRDAQAKLNVVATLPDLAAIAQAIAGDKADVKCIGKPNEDPHYIQAKPSFIVTLNNADVLIQNGLDLEIGWLPALVDQTRNAKIRAGAPGLVTAAEGVPLLEIPTAPVTRAEGDVHPGGNPHFSIDPENAKIMAKNIAGGLARVDPADSAVFQANLETLLARIQDSETACLQAMEPYRGTKVVTYHKSLTYFCQRFGLTEVGTIEPKPGIPPSPSHITDLIELMKRENVKLILMEPWHERRTPDLVAQQTGAKVVEFAAQVGGSADIPDYPALCRSITTQLVDALKK